jgi:hypothetical protein
VWSALGMWDRTLPGIESQAKGLEPRTHTTAAHRPAQNDQNRPQETVTGTWRGWGNQKRAMRNTPPHPPYLPTPSTVYLPGFFGVDSSCWKRWLRFTPRAVPSLVPSGTIAKHTSFNCFLKLSGHAWERWLVSFQDKLISFHLS